MASNNIARLGVVLGLDTAEFTASIDKAIQENKKLGQAIKRDSNAAAGEIISLKNATDDYGKTLTKVQLIEREISQGRFRMATDEVKSQLLAQAAAYDKVAAGAHKAAGGLTAWQKQGLMYQTTDFFTQIASGQSVMIAAIQQGGQLKDQMGGLGNMFRVLTPIVFSVTGAFVAVGVGIAGAAFAAYSGRKEFDALTNSIILTGNYSKITVDEFGVMASTIANTSRASIGDAKDILNAMIGSGQFTNKTFDSVSKTIQRFSELSGLAASEAAAKLIPALDGSASSARKLNDQYNFLTLEQYKHIEALDKQGKKQESIIYTSDLLKESFDKTKTELGYLDQALDGTTKMWGDFWNAAMNMGKPDTVAEKIINIQKKINLANNLRPAADPTKIGMTLPGDAAYDRKLASLEDKKNKLVAELVKIQADSEKMEGQKGAIKKYGDSGGVDTELSRKKQAADAKRALEYAYLLAAADDEQKIYLESNKIREDMYANYLLDIATKDKDFQGQRLRVYLSEVEKEGVEYLAKLDDFNQKRINKAVDAAQAERFARQKIDDEESNKRLERLGEYTNAYYASAGANQAEKDKLEAQIKMVGMSEKQVKFAEIEAKYQADIAKNILEAKGDKGVLDQWNALAAAKKNDAKLNVELTDQLTYMKEVNDTVWKDMTSALDEFVNTGSINFSKLTQSIIQDLLKIQLKKQALALWETASGGGGVTGAIAIAAKFMGFADGGEPPVGVPSMVGERGPELFVPKTAGTIIPNNMLKGNDSGQTINYNGPYIANMSAIDTQSGVAFLAKNKQAVWATYQSANRSVPMSR
jgi:phage-related minor tail protein